ncbi:MAG: hypothetical protein DRH30_00580 [Deltaproteobacteria bacterium]|nr:MAG: hypothetical protein DRH30_00580 [Deltaproteobacteria bacterium]
MNVVWLKAIRDLAEYARTLEEELDGSDSGEGLPLIVINNLMADMPDIDVSLGGPDTEGLLPMGDEDWNVWHSKALHTYNVRFWIEGQLYDGSATSLREAIQRAIPVPGGQRS